MPNDERRLGNQEPGSQWQDHDDHRSNTYGRRGDIARKTVNRESQRKFASKAARKTFAELQSDPEDEPSNRSERSTVPNDQHASGSKGNRPMGAANAREIGSTRRVTFSPDTHSHPSVSAFERRAVPVRGAYGQHSVTPPQSRTHFASKSANPNMTRRDPFASGINNQRVVRPTQSYHGPQFRPAYGPGMPDQRRPGSSMQASSRFPNMPAGRSFSMPGRGSFSTPSKSMALRRSPPSKSRPMLSLISFEDATWRKGLSPRKTSAIHPGVRPAPRMIAASTPQNPVMPSTKDGHLHADNVGPAVFLGRNMTIYMDGEEEMDHDSDMEEIPADVARRGLAAEKTGKAVLAMQVGRKAGKQSHYTRFDTETDTSEASSEEETSEPSEDEIDSDADGPNTKSDTHDVFIERPPSPSNDLVASLEVLTLSSMRMQQTGQLPFLLRNLRRGFQDRCHLVGVATGPIARSDKSVEVQLIFRVTKSESVLNEGMEYSDEYVTQMISWNCPLCDLHGRLNTREMLQKHLEWDHSEIRTIWDYDHGKSGWSITLFVPGPQFNQFPSVPVQNEIVDGPSQLRSPPRPTPIRSPTGSPVLSSIPLAVSPVQESPVHFKLKNRPPSPPRSVTPSASQSSLSRSRSRSVTTTSSRQQTREPSSQPPSHDPFGPTAQHPYLPADPVDGQIYFSCRPGGPRIYDLLNTLPLAPFGILSWYIVDREEELFEADDVLDEDKVMQALWGRWILLNHRKFLAHYLKGTMAFIDEYWRMIHKAAGWAALRAWLLMFVVNRYLTGSEVAQILRHYERLIGMDSWFDAGS